MKTLLTGAAVLSVPSLILRKYDKHIGAKIETLSFFEDEKSISLWVRDERRLIDSNGNNIFSMVDMRGTKKTHREMIFSFFDEIKKYGFDEKRLEHNIYWITDGKKRLVEMINPKIV